ncbi:hypothetical protein T484DRAFT_1940991 [Baffinella frigidus]|nr:hypothetical protein T484DRAFT_1940991 [Cryptophyta sp. CCMP2293]
MQRSHARERPALSARTSRSSPRREVCASARAMGPATRGEGGEMVAGGRWAHQQRARM